MHRRAALSFTVLLLTTGGASLAHADHLDEFSDLQFGNLTAVEPGDDTFSVDVQITLSTELIGFQMDYALDGLALQSMELLNSTPSWYLSYSDDQLIGLDFTGSSIPATVEPIGLFRMNLAITEFSGPQSITLSEILMSNPYGDPLSVQQDSYTFTIPAPATLALLAGGLGGFRRRRAG